MTTSPNLGMTQILDPISFTDISGTYPNPEEFVALEMERLLLEMQVRFQSNDQAIVSYVNAQLLQARNLINGLAEGTDLQAALEVLENLRNIVDANGDGILDSLAPLNSSLNNLSALITALQGQTGDMQSVQAAMSSDVQILRQNVNVLGTGLEAAHRDTHQNQVALLAIANNMGRNLQAIRNAFTTVNVTFTPIVLPAPVFQTTNVVPPSSDPSDV